MSTVLTCLFRFGLPSCEIYYLGVVGVEASEEEPFAFQYQPLQPAAAGSEGV